MLITSALGSTTDTTLVGNLMTEIIKKF